MPDLDQLDRAFDALARDLAHSSGPGAAAAVTTARQRRRTRAGAVALAAAVVLGGAVAVPRVAFPEDGVAARGGSARLDAAALEAATEGWTDGWELWERYSPKGGGGYAVPCPSSGPGEALVPEPQEFGISRFVAWERSSAGFVLARFANAAQADEAQRIDPPFPDTCDVTTTFIDVDGVEVRHDSVPVGAAGSDLWLGDVWSARIGSRTGRLEVVVGTRVADEVTADRVAEALVAGMRDGWTQSPE